MLLVDTGFDREGDASPENAHANARILTARLAEHDLRPDDVSHVFLTHLHRDHIGDLALFPQAQWRCHRLALADYAGPDRERFRSLEDGDPVIPRTTALHTPGHTQGHSSILWVAEDKTIRVAVCGDAILSLAWLQSGHTWRFNTDFFDLEAAKQSAGRLLAEADLLIPGHGEPFFARSASGGRRKRLNGAPATPPGRETLDGRA
jgi:glyoxylase-like metal-dependent hydrolase (beta-lactamase superfamily II)